MNPKLHVTVATVVQQEGRFLLVEELVNGNKVFNQPAGHVEHGESLVEAAVRETFEETGWHVEIDSLVAMYRWQSPDTDDTFFRFSFSGSALKYNDGSKLDDGILRTVWMTPDELQSIEPRLRSPMVLRCIEDYIANKRFPLDVLTDL